MVIYKCCNHYAVNINMKFYKFYKYEIEFKTLDKKLFFQNNK